MRWPVVVLGLECCCLVLASCASLPGSHPYLICYLLRKMNIEKNIFWCKLVIRAAPGQQGQGVPSGRDTGPGHPKMGLGLVVAMAPEPQPLHEATRMG